MLLLPLLQYVPAPAAATAAVRTSGKNMRKIHTIWCDIIPRQKIIFV
jgi:hypothetical protein